MKQKTNEKGITLIALVITIIVMLILVAVSVNIAMNGGIFSKARKAAFQTDVRKYQEELQAYLTTNYESIEEIRNGELEVASENLKTTCIPSYNEEKYGDKFMVAENKLKYIYKKDNEKEEEWAKELGLAVQYKYAQITVKMDGEGTVKVTGEIGENEKDVIQREIECTEEKGFTARVNKKYELTATPGELIIGDLNNGGKKISYVFSKWLKNGKTISTNETVTVMITENSEEYTAVFVPSETLIYYNDNDVFTTAETTINASTYSGTITDKTKITKVLFGNKVTAIGNSAFSGCTGLTKVNFSNSIETIGESAFYGCTGITGEITIPDKVTKLFNYVFQNCSGVTKINLNNVTTINSYRGFIGCSNLEELIGEKITIIDGGRTFEGDTKLSKIILGSVNNPVNKINNGYTFSSISNKATLKIYIDTQGGTVTHLEEESYGAENGTIEYYDSITGECVNVILGQKYNGDKKITWEEIPNKDKITEIRSGAFSGCTNITGEITIPDKITRLNGSVFNGCTGITKINLNNVTSINGYRGFIGCSNLEELIGEKITVIDGGKNFEGDTKLSKITLGSVDNPINKLCDTAFLSISNKATLKIYIDTQSETVTTLANEPWGVSNATIEYYDAKTGNKIN